MILLSPRLKLLLKQFEHDKDELEHFWSEMIKIGTPLIETSPKQHYRYVTFLYREVEPIENVVVVMGPARVDFARNKMDKLANTDIWYRTYEVRNDAKFQYLLSVNDPLLYPIDIFPDYEQWNKREANFQIDSLNKTPYPKKFPIVSTAFLNGEILPQTIPKAALISDTIQSQILANERDVHFYLPPDYSVEVDYPILVILDGELNPDVIPIATIIDELVTSSVIEPIVAVFVENIGYEREKEFGCNEQFSQFLSTELIDFVKFKYSIREGDHTICGFSMGGVCAAYTALCFPKTYHNVISASGSFFWHKSGSEEPEEAIREFVKRGRENINFYLECGLMEDHTEFQSFTGGTSTLQANRHFRDILISKGYETNYHEYNGGPDWIHWADTLRRALLPYFSGEVVGK